jgi:hypothetical protein
LVEPGSLRGWEIDISATALGHSSYQDGRLPNSLSIGTRLLYMPTSWLEQQSSRS